MRGSVWLLLTMAGLGTVVGLELAANRDRDIEPIASSSSLVAELPPLPHLDLAALSALTETTRRPLFTVDRRPPLTEAADDPADADDELAEVRTSPLRFSLSAVVIVDGQALAYLSEVGGGSLTRLRRGESIDGWRLDEIRPDAVVLQNGEQRTELLLRRFEPPPIGLELDPDDLGEFIDEDEDWDDEEFFDDESELRRPRRPKRGPRQDALKRALRRSAERGGD